MHSFCITVHSQNLSRSQHHILFHQLRSFTNLTVTTLQFPASTVLNLYTYHDYWAEGARLSVKQEVTLQRTVQHECLWRMAWHLCTTSCERFSVMSDSYPRSASSGHGGPEEASPVGVLEDVGQDAGEQAGAVQDNLTLSLWGAARLRALDQPLHCLRKKKKNTNREAVLMLLKSSQGQIKTITSKKKIFNFKYF